MEKSSTRLSKKRGDRVKRLLREVEMIQKDLADAIGYTPEHLSAVVNGRRNLTVEAAQAIATEINKRKEPFESPVRYQWIMCFDDLYADTGDDETAQRVLAAAKRCLKRTQMEEAITGILPKFGFRLEPDYGGNKPCMQSFWDAGSQYVLKTARGESLCCLKPDARERFISEICDFIEFKINRLLKEDGNNG